MSCVSGCLGAWWSVKSSVTLTKWPWLCCSGLNGLLRSGPSSASILLGLNGKAEMEDIHKYSNCIKGGCLSSFLIICNDSKGPTVHSIFNSFPLSPFWVWGSKCWLRLSIISGFFCCFFSFIKFWKTLQALLVWWLGAESEMPNQTPAFVACCYPLLFSWNRNMEVCGTIS